MYLTIDIGGTTSRVAVSTDFDAVASVETFDSAADLQKQKESLSNAIRKLTVDAKVDAVCIGIAGIIDKKQLRVVKSPNYPALNGSSIYELLPKNLGDIALFASNDCQLAALGESVLGSGSGFNRVGYLSLGTGVGGALIVNGKFEDSAINYEPGHQIIKFDSNLFDKLGVSGSLEMFASGTAFEKNFKISPQKCDDNQIWSEFGRYVGYGINNMLCMWNPDCIVIGGGVSDNFDRFIISALDVVKPFEEFGLPKINKAAFGQGSGVVGGLVYLKQHIKNQKG